MSETKKEAIEFYKRLRSVSETELRKKSAAEWQALGVPAGDVEANTTYSLLLKKISDNCTEDQFLAFSLNGEVPPTKLSKQEMTLLKAGLSRLPPGGGGNRGGNQGGNRGGWFCGVSFLPFLCNRGGGGGRGPGA